MTFMQKQISVPVKDLRYVAIHCAHCKTAITLDVTAKLRESDERDSLTPNVCPGCGARFDSAIRSHVDAFRKVYTALSPLPGIAFQIAAD